VESEFDNKYTPATEFRAAIALMSVRLEVAIRHVKRLTDAQARHPIPPELERKRKKKADQDALEKK
jgi:hypothetical protein